MWPVERQPKFWGHLLPSFSENKPSRLSSACCQLHDDFLPGLLFSPEDGGNMFLQMSWHCIAEYRTV
jgi:hypothetical protein